MMEIGLIKNFTISCVSCDTETTISIQDAKEHFFREYQCPVCKQQLSGNVSEAISVIDAYNEAAKMVLEMIQGGVISIELDRY